MKITCKTISQEIFYIEANETDSVVELKRKIESAKGYPVDAQRLVSSGRILQDGLKVSDLKLNDKKFIVIMVASSKRADEPSQNATTPIASNTAETPVPSERQDAQTRSPSVERPDQVSQRNVSQARTPSPRPVANQPSSTSSQVQTSSSSRDQAPPTAAAQNSLRQPDVSAINTIVAMGFERSQAIAALAASGNNQDLAVDILLSASLPSQTSAANMQVEQRQPDSDQRRRLLQSVLTDPTVQALRPAIKENPQVLNDALAQLKTGNPEMARIIEENKEQLLEMINTDEEELRDDNASPVRRQQQQQQLNEQDLRAVERLKSLGFPEDAVRQAYLACNRNEALAANLLLDQQSNAGSGG